MEDQNLNIDEAPEPWKLEMESQIQLRDFTIEEQKKVIKVLEEKARQLSSREDELRQAYRRIGELRNQVNEQMLVINTLKTESRCMEDETAAVPNMSHGTYATIKQIRGILQRNGQLPQE